MPFQFIFVLYCATARQDSPYLQWRVKERDFSWCERRTNRRLGVEWLRNALRGSRNCCCSTSLSSGIGQKIIGIGWETQPERDSNSWWQTVWVALSVPYLGPSHWPYKCVTWRKLPHGVIKICILSWRQSQIAKDHQLNRETVGKWERETAWDVQSAEGRECL